MHIAVEGEMSVRSLTVASKFEHNAREALSEAEIGTHLRRSSRIEVPSNINFESRMAETANIPVQVTLQPLPEFEEK